MAGKVQVVVVRPPATVYIKPGATVQITIVALSATASARG